MNLDSFCFAWDRIRGRAGDGVGRREGTDPSSDGGGRGPEEEYRLRLLPRVPIDMQEGNFFLLFLDFDHVLLGFCLASFFYMIFSLDPSWMLWNELK